MESVIAIDDDTIRISEAADEHEEFPFMSSEEESSEPSVIDLMDSDERLHEMQVRRETRSQNNVFSAVRTQRQARSRGNFLFPARVQRETWSQSNVLPLSGGQTRNRSNVLHPSAFQSGIRSQSNVSLLARNKCGDLDQSEPFPPAIASMLSDMSKTMKHIQSLIQRRNAERASDAVPDNNSSTACECPVCREALYASLSCATLCGHVFHAACMHQLAEYHRGSAVPCPVCRTAVHVGELLVLRSGLPEPPAVEQSEPIDLTVQNPVEEKSELDQQLSRTLKTFENLYAERSVFQHCAVEVRKNAQREVIKMKNEMEKLKSRYHEQIRVLDAERQRVQDAISRIAQREERLEASQKKYNQDLMEIAKKKSDLKVLEERLKVEKREAEQKAREFHDLLDKLNDKEQRLDKLRQALDARKKTIDRKRSVSAVVEDSRDTKKHKNQSSFTDTRHSQESPFGEKLRLPSAVNRPPPPRRSGTKKSSQPTFSLSAFVPKRPGINRPSTSVGKRKYESTRS